MRVAAAQAEVARSPGQALRAARGLAAAAAGRGADLLVLPQRFLAGRTEGQAAIAAVAEPSDGPTSLAARELAATCGVAMLYGYVERCTGLLYDALQLVDRQGRAVANYRRAHHRPAERGLLARGAWLTVMPLDGVRLGLLAGHDLDFPEAARCLRLIGCDLLLAAGAPDAEPRGTGILLAARALENGCPIVFASAHPALPAAIIGPDGSTLAATAEGDALAVAELGPAPAAGEALAGRRPRLYQRLSAPPPREADRPP